MVVSKLAICWLIIVPSCPPPPVRHIHFAVPLVKETFANKGPGVVEKFTTQNLAQTCSKLEGSLRIPFPNNLPTLTHSQYFHLPTIYPNCDRWANKVN